MATRRLNHAELLEAASVCRNSPAAETAVYLTTLTRSGLSFEKAARLAIGERDSALAELHTDLFGHKLELAATCPTCETRLDVSLSTDALQIEPDPEIVSPVEIGGRQFRVRAVDSGDLAAVAGIADVDAARKVLALNCLVSPPGEDAPEALSDADVHAVAATLAAIDPASDLYVSLSCFRCETTWDAPLDILRILTAEIVSAADVMLDDVHDL